MQDYNPIFIPMIEARLEKAPDSYICGPQTLKGYQILLGGIMYLIVKMRPDLVYFVFQLAKFDNNPIDNHWKALKRVLLYL